MEMKVSFDTHPGGDGVGGGGGGGDVEDTGDLLVQHCFGPHFVHVGQSCLVCVQRMIMMRVRRREEGGGMRDEG